MDDRIWNVRTIHGLLINKPTSCQTAEEWLQMLAFLLCGDKAIRAAERPRQIFASLLKTQAIAGA
jgi:hypothetical protein